jgi:large subunit ribosomal protein L21
MKYAIVESGGKQYRAVEGGTLEIDRMPVKTGENIKLEQVLLLADGENIMVGTPVIKDNPVWTKVVEHFKGEKVTIFNYSPKKRIRVKTGHRQNYTRLLVEQIGGSVLIKKEPAKVEKTLEADDKSPKAKAAKAEPKARTSSSKEKKPTAAAVSKAKAASAKAETVSSPKGTSFPKGKKPAAKTPAKGKTASSLKGKKPAASVSKKTKVTKAGPKKTTTKAAPKSSPKGTSFPKGKKPAAK